MKNSDELSRLKSLYTYELEEFSNNKNIICGLDEAGRGPLAGPVVSAAVILPRLKTDLDFQEWQGLDDSKKLSSKKREKLHSLLLGNPNVHIGIGIVGEKIIDRINILRATQVSMIRAIRNLDIIPDCLLVDGMLLPKVSPIRANVPIDIGTTSNSGQCPGPARGYNFRSTCSSRRDVGAGKCRSEGSCLDGVNTYQKKIIDGDALSLSIAAASVIAKVTRDSIMCQYHERYPQYGFDRHKGYGTKEHIKNIKKYGHCKIHRMTFYPMTLMKEIGYE